MRVFKTILIVLVIMSLLITTFLWYSGFFAKIEIQEKEIGPFHVVMVEHIGNYAETAEVQDTLYYALRNDGIDTYRGMGIYYDDPATTEKPPEKYQSIVGCILEKKDYDRIKKFNDKYTVRTIGRTRSVVVEYPYINQFSIIAGVMRVYPRLKEYMKQKNYPVPPAIEIYDQANETITYSMQIEQ